MEQKTKEIEKAAKKAKEDARTKTIKADDESESDGEGNVMKRLAKAAAKKKALELESGMTESEKKPAKKKKKSKKKDDNPKKEKKSDKKSKKKPKKDKKPPKKSKSTD